MKITIEPTELNSGKISFWYIGDSPTVDAAFFTAPIMQDDVISFCEHIDRETEALVSDVFVSNEKISGAIYGGRRPFKFVYDASSFPFRGRIKPTDLDTKIKTAYTKRHG